jgi:hypothetical protein
MTKGNASTNIQWMGAIRLIIFERLATTKALCTQRELAGSCKTRWSHTRLPAIPSA